ncbi:hypothetical protein DENSPDRAFT_921528 [Dentipellis sp. KUC8613]|nr:hypothetical protein DENSPDRAFT_921528 [Dentipellis sp. KUC8613]
MSQTPPSIPLTLLDWRRKLSLRRHPNVWEQFRNAFQDAGVTLWPFHPTYSDTMPLQAKVEKFPLPNGYSFVTAHRGLEGKEASMAIGSARDLAWYQYKNDLTRAACLQNGHNVVVRIIVLRDEGAAHLSILRKIATGHLGLISSNHTLPLLKEVTCDCATFGVFPFVGGGHIRNAFDSGWAKTSSGDILDMVMQALEGLAFIHDFNIAHRDAFSDNFLVQWQPESLYAMKVPVVRPKVYLIDFEAAIAFEEDSLPSDRTCTGLPMAKPGVYARPTLPEMQSGQPYDPFKLDVWQLAVSLTFQTGIEAVDRTLSNMRVIDAAERPTAREALSQLSDILCDMPPRSLLTPLSPTPRQPGAFATPSYIGSCH